MNISIITTNLRICGLVRELIEMSNFLKKLGNKVTIYVYEDIKINWINVNSTIIILNKNIEIKSDVLILMDAPHNYLMPYFYNACSKFKTYIITGLDKKHCLYNVIKTNSNSSTIDIEQNKLFKNYEICADGKWQLDFLNKHNIKVGEKIGGININMFYNMNIKRTNEILISGDTRWSKGYDMLMDLLKKENYTTYHNTRNQSNLCKKYNKSLIYIDNHTWAGWCNPVLEAMACGCAVICTNIGATSEFAINNETALVVEPDNIEQFKKALKKLRTNPSLVKKLSISAQEKAKKFKYDIVINKFNNYLKTKLLNHSNKK